MAPGYPVLEIQHATAQARVALHGAQLMNWTPAGQQPVLYLSPEAVFREGKAIRGGVPICWPWFAINEQDPTLPQHGFLRSRFWELVEVTEDGSGVRLVFTTHEDGATQMLWPHSFRTTLEMRIGAELHLALRSENTGDTSFRITEALHSYLAVADARRIRIEGLDGDAYLDTVGPHTERRQSGDIIIDREVDRIFAHESEVRVRDEAGARVLSVVGTGSKTTVVWNPWIEKAKSLSDLPNQDYLRFVCVETANAWRDSVTLAPGESHTLATTIRVSS